MRNYCIFLLCALLLVSIRATDAAEKVTLQQHVPAAVARLQPKGRLPAEHKLQLAIGVPLRNEAKLDEFIQSLQDPNNPNYRQFLTPEQFTEKFGPTKEDYQKVQQFAKEHHLRITHQHANRVVLDVEGNAADVEAAFSVQLNVFDHPTENRTFFAPDTEPSVDAGVPILHVTGLNNYSLPHPKYHKKNELTSSATPHTGSGPGGSLWGNDFRMAYLPGTTLNGTGQSIALLQFDGYYSTDISSYENQTGLPHVPLTVVPVDGGVSTPSDGNGEVCLDIEMCVAMAPGLSRIYVYEAPNPSPWPDLLSRMANDNAARQISCSWGGGGPDPTSEAIFKQMSAQGQTFFNASGDSDAFTGAIEFPSESTNIVQVGATTLTTSSTGAYISESVWNWGGGTGSSGGVSSSYHIPGYQQGISMMKNGGSTTYRNIPDVALTGDNIYVTYDHGASDTFGGTSCAAPLWAGLTALINQQATANARPPVGFINPAIYSIGKGSSYGSAFHDVTTGNNTSTSSPNAFYAVAGYDLCTGWGTPKGMALINALAGPSDTLQITPATGFTATGGVGGPFDTTSETFTLTNSGTTTLNWQVYNSAAWLTVSVNGGTLAGNDSSKMSVNLTAVANTLPAGTYTATVAFTNTSDGVGQTRDFTLNVLGAPIITTQPESQTANQGDTVTFSGAATGLSPMTYQWSFNNTAIPGATTSTVTLSNVSQSDSGTYNLVVANAIGSTTSSNAVLVVYGRPQNDECSGALAIIGDNYANTQSTLLATSVGDPLPACDASFGNGVWYKFTAPVDGEVTVDTFGSDFDTVLAIYTGDCGSLQRINCDDDSNGTLTSQLSHTVTANTTYYYLAGGYNGAQGQLSFHFKLTRPLSMDVQPVPQPTPINGSATFNVSATGGTPPLKYQWYIARTNGAPGLKLVGQTSDTLTLTRVTTLTPRNYCVVVSDSVTPPNMVTSQVANVVLYVAPHFTLQPLSATKVAGNNMNFRATAAGTAPLTYQWMVEGNPIPGATNTLLMCTNVQSSDSGHYQCVVNGAYGSTAMTSFMRGVLTVIPDTDYPTVGILRPPRGFSMTNGVAVFGETNVAPTMDIIGRVLDRGLITNVNVVCTFPASNASTNVAKLTGSTRNSKIFTARVTLALGTNTFVVEASDEAGHKTTALPVHYTLKPAPTHR